MFVGFVRRGRGGAFVVVLESLGGRGRVDTDGSEDNPGR